MFKSAKLGFYSTFDAMHSKDEYYMRRALQLALKGKFSVAPNPRVGCVIVHKNEIIGEGFHQKFGGAHAEVNAIQSVTDQSLLKDSTLYVSLEPCAHYGKTPPCSLLIIEKEIKKVVIASVDSFAAVNGKGIKMLKEAGVEVITEVLKAESDWMNRRFFTFHEKKRPYIILKWAETADGFIGRLPSDAMAHDSWISSAQSKQLVHLWRAEESAIMVGKNTAFIDNPKLDCREVMGHNPLRIVIDKNLELPSDLNLFDQSTPTLIFNSKQNKNEQNLEYCKLDFNDQLLSSILNDLHKRDIQSLIVEGGAYLLNQFIEKNIWDEARQFIGAKTFGKGIKAPKMNLSPIKNQKIGTDNLNYYYQ